MSTLKLPKPVVKLARDDLPALAACITEALLADPNGAGLVFHYDGDPDEPAHRVSLVLRVNPDTALRISRTGHETMGSLSHWEQLHRKRRRRARPAHAANLEVLR